MRQSAHGHRKTNHKNVNPGRDNVTTIPHWSGTFDYHGISYQYSMVGTDPSLGSATTLVPTYLVPLRFVFADGSVVDAGTEVLDGQTAVQAITNSPIFQFYPFSCGGISMGTTQYSDAFQRANFWNDVSTRSKDYHVLLGRPTVLPTQTINVPADQGGYFPDPFGSGTMIPYVYGSLLGERVYALINQFGLSPRSLPIFVTGRVIGGGLAYHGVFDLPAKGNSAAALQTYVVTCYLGQTSPFSMYEGPDVMPLSHEINEWMDDPFLNNFTPGWDDLIDNNVQCDSDIEYGFDLLEVGDAIAALPERGITALSTSSYVYHVQDTLFLDFFRRSAHSNSAGGQFSFFGSANSAASPCTGHLQVSFNEFSVPGAAGTFAHAINNRGQIVGDYRDSAGVRHSFLFQGGHSITVDPPGSIYCFAQQINDAGVVVGLYYTPDGLEHGFSYQNGHYVTLDFPGAPYTEANGITDGGQIVGDYTDNNGFAHGFVLDRGHYQSVDAPGAANTILSSANNAGLMTGYTYADFSSPALGFLRHGGYYTGAQFPGSLDTVPYGINNFGTYVGLFDDANGYFGGFVNLFGYYYDVYVTTIGINDSGQMVGYTYDENGIGVGVTAQLPTNPADH